jgi:hypothetical protein
MSVQPVMFVQPIMCVQPVMCVQPSQLSIPASQVSKYTLPPAGTLRNDQRRCCKPEENTTTSSAMNAKAKIHNRSLSYAWYRCRCHLLCLGSCLARGFVLQLFIQTYHRLLQHFGTSITNAYSTHFVKPSGLNAKAKFH